MTELNIYFMKSKRKPQPWHEILGELTFEGPRWHQCLALQCSIMKPQRNTYGSSSICTILHFFVILYYRYEKNAVFHHPWYPIFYPISHFHALFLTNHLGSSLMILQRRAKNKSKKICFSVFIPPDDGRELKDPAHDVGKRSDIHILGIKLPHFFFY